MPVEDASAQPRLWARTLRALDEADLRHCQLRGSGQGAAPVRLREIDLLVEGRDLERLAGIVSGLGFVKLRAWGHGGHRFFVAYEESMGAWLKLDVVTSLRYGGSHRPLFAPALAGCLDRRQRVAGTWVADSADALLGLVLHTTLDKQAFKEEHRRELERLRAVVEAEDALQVAVTERFDRALGRALRWREAATAITDGKWEWLLSRRRPIAWELFRREPIGSVWRWSRGVATRLARPLLVALGRRGFCVALLGPDGAGKSTLARALAEDPQIQARIVYMGSNPDASTAGLPSTRWIERQRRARPAGPGRDLLSGIAYGNRLLEQGYRSLVALTLRLRGRFVVFDRHPCELLIAEPASGRGPKLRRWILRSACLRPDLMLLLDAPPEMLHSRKGGHTLERLERQRDRYRALPLASRDVVVVDASVPREECVRLATSMIWARYRQHVERTSSQRGGPIPARVVGRRGRARWAGQERPR